MSDPKLAEVVNPRLAMNRRMAKENQAAPAMPDTPASAPKFGKKWTPEERAKQNAALAKMLSGR